MARVRARKKPTPQEVAALRRSVERERRKAPRTEAPLSSSERKLKTSVDRELAKVKAGTSQHVAGTGNILKDTKPANRAKLKVSVNRELDKVKAGTSQHVAGTGDILKGTKRARTKLPNDTQAASVVPPVSGLKKAARSILGFSGRAVKDIVTLPVTIAQGTYESAAADYEMLAKGDYKRARKLYEGFRDNDPVALAAQGKFKKAGKSISEHPGLFAVEVAGIKGTAGRGITKVQKRVGKNPTLREPARDPATKFAVKRKYSEDAINRGVQKRRERRRITLAEGHRVKADAMEKAGYSGNEIVNLRREANRIDPRVTNAKQARVAAARAHDVHKIISERKQGAIDKTLLTAMHHGDDSAPNAALTLHLQRVTDGTPESLRVYRDKLQAQHDAKAPDGTPVLGAAERAANRKTRADVEKALKKHPAPEALRAKGAAVEAVLRPMQDRLVKEGILPASRGRKAPLTGYAVTRMEGVRPGAKGPVRDVPGRANPKRVKAGEIEAHMAERGVAPGVYISNRPPRVAGGAGGVAGASRITGQARTGRAITTGTADLDPTIIRRTARTQQRLLDHADAYRAKLNQFGSEKSMTRAQAVKHAEDMQAKHGMKYVAVPRQPFAGDKAIAKMAHSGMDPDSPVALETVHNAIDAALQGKSTTVGDYTVMSEAAANEARALSANDAFMKGVINTTLRAVSTHFSRNVLSTSPSWITGNAVEGQVRSIIGGTRPRDAELFRRVVDEVRKIDPYKADELQAYGSGAGHHGSAGRLEHGNFLAQYESTAVEPLARRLSDMWAKPGPAAASKAWSAYTDFMFKSVSGRLESNFQSSMSGAIIRKSGLVDPRLPKLSDEAVAQAARGMINTTEQAALGEELAQMFGRYAGRTADTKRFITNYTPFANWALSAADFVFRVLPRDHPTITALSAALDNATADLYDNEALPDWLRGSINLKGGAHLRISRYLPFGAFSSIPDTVSNLVLPQFSSALKALQGEDWTGKKLYDKHGKPISDGKKAQLAAQAFLEGTVPFMSRITNVVEKGPMQTVKSTLGYVKPQKKPSSSSGGSSSSSSSTSTSGSGIDFSTYGGLTDSGIDFSTYGTGP